MFNHVKPGDKLTRVISGSVKMTVTVQAIDELFVYCRGEWKFSRLTGGEVDEDLGWTATQTGSWLMEKES